METTNHTIVLIHGFGFDSSIWEPIAPAFSGYHVIKLSLPGFGDTHIKSDYSIPELAGYYWEKLDLRENHKVHLVGHSMGGYVVMEMAAQQPDRIGSIALMHSHVFEDPADKKTKRDEALASIQQDGHEAFAKKMIGGMVGSSYESQATTLLNGWIEKGIARGRDAWLHGIAAMRDRHDHGKTLEQLHVPVLMIMGEEDGAIPLPLVYKQAAMAERADLLVFPGVGHLSMYEKTGEVISALRQFYKNIIG